MKSNRWVLIISMIVCLGIPTVFLGQATSSAITGMVRDTSQAVIAGALVSVTNSDTGVTRTNETDAQGRFRLGELQPGTYQITVSMAGFSKETRKGVVLLVGQEPSFNFVLQVGAVEQALEVTGAAPIIETTTAAVAAVVGQEQLRELPLNGRSFVDLVTLQPGTVTPSNAAHNPNYGGSPQLSVAGARTDSNSFMIDGTDINGTSNNTPGSAASVQLGVDTIREFQVIISNAKAEYGRSSGAIINSVTRSGTNQWHGAAFEFLRNNALDARNFFDQNGVPPFKRNQFGVTLGGPIKKNRTFFFLGYEGLRQRLTETRVYNTPTAAARLGILPTRTVPVSPRIVPYINLYPLPNGADLGGGIGEFATATREPTGENYGSARIDHNFSASDFLFGRYTVDRADSRTIQTLLSDQIWRTTNTFVTIQEDHIFSPALLNAFRVGYNHSINNAIPTVVPGGESLGFVPGQPIGQISAGGLSAIGPGGTIQLAQAEAVFQFEDDLSFTHGGHTMKFGAMAERFRWNTDQAAFIQGSIAFNNLENFLQAGPSGTTATVELPSSNTYRGMRTTMLAFFAQDDYKVTPNLMVNYGLRWEFTTGLTEKDGLISYLRRGPLVSDYNDLVTGKLWDNRIKNFEPRLGFNWALDKNQKTALSGGFGIYHNQVLHTAMSSFRAQLPFYSRGSFSTIDATKTFPDIVAMIASAAGAPGVSLEALTAFRVTRQFDYYDFKTPAYYRYNLTLQRELPGQMAIQIGYVGAVARHLMRRQSLNTFPVPVRLADGSLFFPPSPVPQAINPNFSQIEFMTSDVNSSYNSLQVNLQKQFSRGLIFRTSYTFSKSLDDYSQSSSNYNDEAGANPQYAPDRTLDRAQSTFNVPRVFVANAVYELPLGPNKPFLSSGGPVAAILGGWQTGGIVTIQQGAPFTVGSNASTTGYRFTATRPNLKSGVNVNDLTGGPRESFFDTSAFTVPPPGTIGNASRDLLLGPGLSSVNFTLSKFFALGERMKLQFRSEFFNFFNHTNFSNPQARVFTSASGAVNPAAGRIVSTSTTSRQIQFGLKLTF